ncbi:MAG: DUF998 domain-containing protein [Candidatus Thorarchaeota archaeon]|jgi:hypothetical protein
MSLFQILAICGMLSPILYTAMWIYGGILDAEYSHIRQDISFLISVDATHKKRLDKFLISSSVLLLIFYTGLHWGIDNGNGSPVGPALFLISSVFGVVVALFFPLDPGGEIVTRRGKMHLLLVVLMGLLTIGGMVALWYRLNAVVEWTLFASFSLITAIVALVLVVISGAFIMSKYRGLLERFSVTTYQVYYFVLALMVFLIN